MKNIFKYFFVLMCFLLAWSCGGRENRNAELSKFVIKYLKDKYKEDFVVREVHWVSRPANLFSQSNHAEVKCENPTRYPNHLFYLIAYDTDNGFKVNSDDYPEVRLAGFLENHWKYNKMDHTFRIGRVSIDNKLKDKTLNKPPREVIENFSDDMMLDLSLDLLFRTGKTKKDSIVEAVGAVIDFLNTNKINKFNLRMNTFVDPQYKIKTSELMKSNRMKLFGEKYSYDIASLKEVQNTDHFYISMGREQFQEYLTEEEKLLPKKYLEKVRKDSIVLE